MMMPPGNLRKAAEVALRLHVTTMAATVPLLVRLLPLWLLLGVMTPPRRLRPYGVLPPRQVVQAVQCRLVRPRLMRRRACLRRGLLLLHFLRLAGVPAQLNFGAFAPQGEGQRMHAHCWITVRGRCLADAPREPVAIVLVHGSASAT